ncbi:MAG: DUF6514 family protein [Oscillospiraceae bacterium]|nr:DUF6514 family protein [Oscillospiraceae bacterium]
MNCLKKYPMAAGEEKLSMELTSMEVVDEFDDIRYTTYGVRVTDEEGGVIFAALDVDTRREYVQQFVELCVRFEARVIHLPDILEDYLA